MISNEQLYELGWLPFSDITGIQGSFDTLPSDSYVEDRLRSRCYSCYKFSNGVLERLPQKDFMQTGDINKALGDVERAYEDIDSALETNPIFLKMFEEFQTRTNLNEDSAIEAHQIRWHCKAHVKEPAPEGVHQDGFDFLAVYMVNSHNVDGGEIMIYKSLDEAPCFKKKLENGEFAVLNDRLLYHNAAPLVPTANNEDGHWDVFVLTANDTGN